MQLSEADRIRVTEAVTVAEAQTDGEIVTIVARRSDAYHDVGLHWAVLTMLLALALLASVPGLSDWLHALVADPWSGPATPAALYTIALVVVTAAFLIGRYVFALPALRMALTPGATKARRVRARATTLFHAAAERRTRGRTGVLLYLSLAEHRAEIVADAAIHGRVAPERWGEAMAALIAAVKDGRPADGMADAVTAIGAILAEHFPRSDDDTNELPDRLIEL
ncbi:TPM domain-containing protein [Sphingomonas sp. Leaf343]|uniref:TPM domain-containing protein n=1 Tax=Sphingomonas sp. Leaf343 TaxID=1736345 RepID=UPI0009E6AB45|nr:TPM domain-containing protein [Sphingomonas sp. Leaf343]